MPLSEQFLTAFMRSLNSICLSRNVIADIVKSTSIPTAFSRDRPSNEVFNFLKDSFCNLEDFRQLSDSRSCYSAYSSAWMPVCCLPEETRGIGTANFKRDQRFSC